MITKEQMGQIDEIITVLGYKQTIRELMDIINSLRSALEGTALDDTEDKNPIEFLYKDAMDYKRTREENYKYPNLGGVIGTEAWQKYYHACGPDYLIQMMKRCLVKEQEDGILSDLTFHYGGLHEDCLKCLYYGQCTRTNIKSNDGHCFMDEKEE